MRRKSQVKNVMFEVEEPPKPMTQTEQIWNYIADRGQEGAILSEMYEAFPDISPRHTRGIVFTLVNKNMVTTDHSCRCGRSTVYIAKLSKKKKDLAGRKKVNNMEKQIREAKKYKGKGYLHT